jgi:F420-dependent oxidoreductase-like protein
MRLSLMAWVRGGERTLDDYVEQLRRAVDNGFSMVWTPQVPWGADLIALMGAALREVTEVTVGTAVVPIQSRLPMVLAQQALTLNAIGAGRFKLGIGLTHQGISEGMWGIPWDRPVRRMNDYLDGLLPLLNGQRADVDGEITTTHGQLQMKRVVAPPVYLAALGPQLLRIAGRRTAGTITWMTGPRTLAGHIVPSIRAAADEMGRSAEVIAGLSLCISDQPAAVREFAAVRMAGYGDPVLRATYGEVTSYRAMLDREGLADPVDVALIGNEAEVVERMDEIAATGVDELAASILAPSPDDAARTMEFLGRYSQRHRSPPLRH